MLVVLCGGSVAGLLIYRRFVPSRDDLTHNDVAGPIIATVGTILAVVLSFMLVTVWQEYDQAGATVQTEASALSDLYHTATFLPPAVDTQIRDAIQTYIGAVLHNEWPDMRNGNRSIATRRDSLAIRRVVSQYQPSTPTQQALQQVALGLIQKFADSRQARLFANQQGIPLILWFGNALLAAITIGFCYIFRVRSALMHVVMTALLAAVIAIMFALIAEFDYPFRGDIQIAPTPFVDLQQTLFTPTGSD